VIHIAARTFDLLGYLDIAPLPGETTDTYGRRVSRVATLDGGVAVSDRGYSHGDRTLVYRWRPVSEEENARAKRLVSLHPTVTVSTKIDEGSGAGKLKLYDNSDALLATFTLTDPAGTVTGTQLTITASGDATATGTGTCTYATLTDSDDTVVATIPVSEGGVSVSNEVVLSETAIVTGASIELISFTVG